jgi:dolichyl-phosphate beta-glucosyltransferase
MDADLATDISELKKFWSKREQADCVIGNRNNEHNKRDVMRNIAGGLSHGLVNTVLNLKLKDTQCGFKLLSAKTKNMWSQVHSERRGFDFELLYLLQKNGYSIKEIDVKRNDVA